MTQLTSCGHRVRELHLEAERAELWLVFISDPLDRLLRLTAPSSQSADLTPSSSIAICTVFYLSASTAASELVSPLCAPLRPLPQRIGKSLMIHRIDSFPCITPL